MPRISVQERERALGQLQAGRSGRDVAATFGCHLATIYRLGTRHHLTGAVNDRPRSGRPRVTSQHQDRHIRFVHLRERSRPAAVTTRDTAGTHNNRISGSTVRRCLHNSGLRAQKSYIGPVLSRRHRRDCLQWCQQHRAGFDLYRPFQLTQGADNIRNGPLKYEKHTLVLTVSKITMKFSRFF